MAGDLCKRCQRPQLAECNNGGIPDSERDLLTHECPNLVKFRLHRMLTERLGVDSKEVPAVSSSLFVPGKTDKTQENLLFITNTWSSLFGPLKWVLGCKGTNFRWKIITDGDLLDAFFRKEPRPIDLVDESIPLVILRLGLIGHKNRAAPGLIHEIIERRYAMCRPLWVVWEKAGKRSWDVSYSEVAEEFLCENFEVLSFNADEPVEEAEEVETDVGITVDEDPPPRPKATYHRPVEQEGLQGGDDLMPWEKEAQKRRPRR